jgi:hypothetical protein
MPFPTETANPSEIGQLAGVAVLIDKSDAGRGVPSSAGLIGLSTLDEVLQQTQAMLLQFSQRQDFDQLMIVAFGENHDVATAELFFKKLAQGNDVLPRVELIDGDSLNGAYGVYSQANDTVYLSRIFVEAGNLEALTGVLIEEFGHGIDARVNAIDTVGDEGDIFSRLVRQQPIDEESLRFLKMEDDHAQVTIDGVSFTVEQSQDFNQDSQMDILWRNYATGQNGVWLMNGTTQVGWNPVSPVADANWRIEGTGDFNQDGQTDILWRHYGTGQVGAWLMNGSQSLGWAQIGVVQDLNWRIEGTGDFNQDGKTDLVWRHYGSGQVGAWLMNGVQYQAWADLGMVQDSNWRIDGVGDFNQDGKSDLIWRHYGSGQVGAWIMSGTQIQSWAQIGVVQDSNWRIEGTADFNQDGHTDLLWRHYGSGQVGAWLMNGNIYQSWRDLGVVADPNWQPVMSAYSDMRPTVTIAVTDNVAAETSLERYASRLIKQNTDSGRFTLTRTGNLTNALTVNYTVGGTATNGIDYSPLTGIITFLAGKSQVEIDIVEAYDDLLEGTETVVISLSDSPAYKFGTIKSASVSILDDEVPGNKSDLIVMMDLNSKSIIEGATFYFNYADRPMILNNGSAATDSFYVRYWISNDTILDMNDVEIDSEFFGPLAGGGNEFVSDRVLTHKKSWGIGPKYFLVQVDGYGSVAEFNESNNVTYRPITIFSKPVISITTTDSSVTEANAGETVNPGRFTLSRTGDNIAVPLTVNYSVDGSATNGSDYSNLAGTVTFAAGSNQAVIDVTPINDNLIEDTETITVTLLSNSTYNLDTVTTASLSMTDNDVDIVGQISLSQTSAIVGDSITVGSYSSNYGLKAVNPTYVRYWLSNYTNLESSPSTNILLGESALPSLGAGTSGYNSINFVYNESWGSGTKYIISQADAYNNVAETKESNNISFRSIEILGKQTVSIASTDAAAAESNTGEIVNPGQFTFTRTGNIAAALTVNYAISGSATNGADYNALPANVTFAAGSNQAIINIASINDALVEDTETVIITLASNTNYQLGTTTTASVSIFDNDLDLIIQNQAAPASAFVGDTINISSYTKNNGSVTTGSNFVRYWLSNDTILDGSDLSLGYNSVGILGGGTSEYDTFSFSYNGAQGTGTKYILFQADGYGYIAEANESNNVSYAAITLSNKPTISISATDSTSGETIAGATANPGRFTLTRTENTNSALTISYTVSGTATNGTDYGTLSGSVGFVAGSSQAVIDINPIDDTFTEQTENVIITLIAGSTYNLGSVAVASISIIDNDATPDLVIQNAYAPSSAWVGDQISVSSWTSNIGTAVATSNYVRYWLSSDTILDAADIFLNYQSVGALNPGGSETDNLSFTYDASWGVGTKYILFQADGYASVAESNESNNITSASINILDKPNTYKSFDPNKVFSLSSNPNAKHIIYLDFNGHTTEGTSWNTTYGSSVVTPKYDTNGDTSTFSAEELQNIYWIWQRVSEDFAPFNINVTTMEPALNELIKSDSNDDRWGIRVAVGGSYSDWYKSPAGGVAGTSFGSNSGIPVFVFSKDRVGGNEQSVAEAISHEVGHTMGLWRHDGIGDPNIDSYYGGHGSGVTGWAPIMGSGSSPIWGEISKELSQWSKGEYAGASNTTDDDLSIIANQNNGFGYRTDDYANNRTTALALFRRGGAVETYGIIEQNTDIDWFSFTTSGSVNLTVNPFVRGANLDILARLYNASGQWIADFNPTELLSASLQLNLTSGNYFLSVEGTGKGDPQGTGYSKYGSLGQYSITGTIA